MTAIIKLHKDLVYDTGNRMALMKYKPPDSWMYASQNGKADVLVDANIGNLMLNNVFYCN